MPSKYPRRDETTPSAVISQPSAMELSELHSERAMSNLNILRDKMERLQCDGNLQSKELLELANSAEDIALSLQTASLLQDLITALDHCPQCGADLRKFYR